jgi:hypothetical protein
VSILRASSFENVFMFSLCKRKKKRKTKKSCHQRHNSCEINKGERKRNAEKERRRKSIKRSDIVFMENH